VVFTVGASADSCTPGSSATLVNTATASATGIGSTSVTANGVSVNCGNSGAPNLSITKSPTQSSVTRGGTINYTINLLEALGYWSGVEYLGFGEDVFAKVKADKEHLLKQVNTSIESTHL
jgi:hypothetical protein